MRSAVLSAVAVLAATICTVAPAAAAPVCADGGVTSYQPPDQPAGPFGVTAGPGGTWYSDGAYVNRVNHGETRHFAIPDETAVGWLTWDGAGSAIWFAGRSSGRIGTIDGRGRVHEYQIPDGVNGAAVPQAIVLGPGPHGWFTDEGNDRIGEVDTGTGAMTFFPVPSGDPLGMARGADGALYFTERDYDKVGRLAPDGTFTEWSLLPGAFPNRIVRGADGAIWITELRTGQIGRIASDGTLTETPIAGGPVGITVGPGGKLYVALWNSRQLGRLDGSGRLTRTWAVPGALQVAGSRGDLWLTDPFAPSVASVHPTCGR
jgi:virginiamycin B lyase